MSFTSPAFTGSRNAFSNMVFVPQISTPYTLRMVNAKIGAAMSARIRTRICTVQADPFMIVFERRPAASVM